MIFSAFYAALGQLGDPRFMRVFCLGIGLSLALLVGIYALFLGAIEMFTPETIAIPFVGEVQGLDTLLSWGSFILMIGLSIFLMVPVASAFSALFFEDIAAAVEARHYPSLPPIKKLNFGDTVIDALNFLGVLVGVNILAFIFYVFTGPLIPVFFWTINGLLLGREYFQVVAMRRIGRAGAKALRKRHFWVIWMAGILMAAPLSIPLVSLIIPVLGVATFTHLYHRLEAIDSSSQNPEPQ